MNIPAYRDPARSVNDRVEDLLARLTIEEKAGQLTQYFYFGVGELPDDFDINSLPEEHRAFLLQPKMVESAAASGGAGSVLFIKDPATANHVQRLAVESGHGIPLLFGFDVVHGLRTIFPVPIAQAASWDPAGIEAAQRIAARESRASGIHWTFAPMIDVTRDARWGRIIEGAGEDPHLASAVATAQVRGFQGEQGEESVLAGPKHFAGYGAARGGRDYDDAEISDSELHNVYLPPFQAAIDAGAANVMTAYMDLNGVPATGNSWLITDVLRGELGFDGFVVSDANAVKSLETQHFAASAADAAARAVQAGLDMEMCMFEPAFAHLPDAVASGRVDESTIDRAVRRVLAAKFRLGLFENPYVDEATTEHVLGNTDHRDAAQISAERAAVLLKNEDLLPLDASTVSSIAVIGQLADSKRDTLGPWVFGHDVHETVTVLDGIRARVGEGTRVEHADGAGIPARIFPSMFDQQDLELSTTPADYPDDEEMERAVTLAAASDVAIVVVGERQNQVGENASRSTLDLPGRQLEQLQRIAETGTPVVLLVMSGRPLDLRWADQNLPAILQVWYPGTRGGHAIASVLFGDVSPAGRLPFSWPRHVGHVPLVYSHLRTFKPEDQDKRYWDEESTPLYPFGHGLSYGSFEYSELEIAQSELPVGATTTVSVSVTNRSDREADEVVQLYIHQRHGAASRPLRELKGFERITLAPAESRTVSFEVGPTQLRYWSASTRGWTQDPTTIDFGVGGSSNIELASSLVVTASR